MSMIALLAAAASLSGSYEPSPVRRVEGPLSAVPLSRIGFSCLQSDGLPTLRMDRENARDISYNQVGDPFVIFAVNDPTGTAVYEGDDHEGRYLLTIDGTTARGNGIADGLPVRIELTIRRVANYVTTADYVIRAGAFTRRETMCGTMPMPPRSTSTPS
jgi:hypothetical protein